MSATAPLESGAAAVPPGGPAAAPPPPLPPSGAAPGGRVAAMPFILAVVLIDMLAIGVMVPVLPHMVGVFTASPAEQAFWFGVVVFVFGAANFVGSPILGALSDRFGRRPVLLIGFAGLAISFYVTALATALWMLVLVRLVGGAMQANAAVANAYVADITPPQERARRFGLLGAMFGLGFVLGPMVGGLLGDIDVRLPFFVSGTLALLNWLYGWFVLPESLPRDRRRPFAWRRANPWASLRGLARLQGMAPLVVVIALSSLAQFVLHTSWVLYTKFKFGWGPAQVGWSLFVVGLVAVLVQGFLLKHLLKRFSARRLAALGALSGGLAYLGYGLATEGWMLYVIIACNLLGAAAAAAMQALVSNAAGHDEQGQAMGALSSLNSLMLVLAPLLATPLLGAVSHRAPGDWLIGLPLYFCAALQLTAAALAVLYFRRPAPTLPTPR